MAKYKLLKNTIVGAKILIPPFNLINKTFLKDSVIDGKSYDNGKTISTRANGKMPDEGIMGQMLYAIPIENLQPADEGKGGGVLTPPVTPPVTPPAKTQTTATASTIFTKKNIMIGIVVIAGVLILWKGKTILKTIS